MKITSFEEFRELARRWTFVPVCKEIVADLLTPLSAFLKIAEHADYAFLLESVEGGEHGGRYSVLGQDPFPRARARAHPVAEATRDRGDSRVHLQPLPRAPRRAGARGEGTHCRRGHLPGRALAALRSRGGGRSVHRLSRAAPREPVAL